MPINVDLSTITASGDGKYYEANPAGDASVSFGSSALLVTASGGMIDGNTITVTTDGTYAFGATGPDIVVLMDAADYALGAADGSEIRQGTSVSSLTGGTFNVVSDATLPAGKGWQMGDETEADRITCSHTASTQLFESQTYYRSAASITAAKGEDITSPAAWQMKPVWNSSDLNFSGGGTDVFVVRPCVNTSGSSQSVRPTPYISSNSVPTVYFGTDVDDPADANNYPYSVPYTMELVWDQGTADGVTADGTLDYFITASNGLINSASSRSSLQLTANQPSKVINSFTYPGFFTGLSIASGSNLIDTEYYRAIGPGAACRVAISNNADYFSASKKTILWTNSWSGTSITAELRSGWFDLSNLTGLYINVIDASNTQVGSVAL